MKRSLEKPHSRSGTLAKTACGLVWVRGREREGVGRGGREGRI